MRRRVVTLAVMAIALASCASGSTARTPGASAEGLREEARSSCVGVSDVDRDTEPFAQRDLVEAVTEIVETNPHPKLGFHQRRGVEIVLRAQRGLTRAWLERVLQCRRAFHAVRPEAEGVDDPLAVQEARVSVTETESGFAVSVRSDDDAQAREIVRRAQVLMSRALTPPSTDTPPPDR